MAVSFRVPSALLLLSYIVTTAQAWVSHSSRCHRPSILSPFTSSSTRLLAARIQSVIATGLGDQEVDILHKTIQEIADDCFVDLTCDEVRVLVGRSAPESVPGATGRVVVLGVDANKEEEDSVVDFQVALNQQWDNYLRSGWIGQPFLLSIEPADTLAGKDESALLSDFQAFVKQLVTDYNLRVPFPKSSTNESLVMNPTIELEVNGPTMMDPSMSAQTASFDTQSVIVFDGLISEKLRHRLFNVVMGYGDNDPGIWNDATYGPDPRRWVQGGLVDNLEEEPQSSSGCGFGLTAEATENICYQHHNALQDLECILSSLFPSVALSRCDGSAMGEAFVTPLTANAPMYGDTYEPHIDADPLSLPPSPWTDIFGRYPNRSEGKPRFMSCLVYINDVWEYDAWGAPTRIWDGDTTMDIEPKPGRIVLMDQDVMHSVVAPKRAAGKRPRYSLVWKLILHPTCENQDMKVAIRQPMWPEPTRVSSVAIDC